MNGCDSLPPQNFGLMEERCLALYELGLVVAAEDIFVSIIWCRLGTPSSGKTKKEVGGYVITRSLRIA
jgi:hypothetical protein